MVKPHYLSVDKFCFCYGLREGVSFVELILWYILIELKFDVNVWYGDSASHGESLHIGVLVT